MEPGFEDNPKVAGGLVAEPTWWGDALVRLRFESCTTDLPLHIHEQSDRCIVALEGNGMFHYADEHQDIIQSHAVALGTMLLFSRGLIHTFTAGSDGLGLLSYHAPFFAFDDRRQWTVPERARRLQPQVGG